MCVCLSTHLCVINMCVLYVHICQKLNVPVKACKPKTASAAVLCPALPYSLGTGFLTESGSKQEASKPQ